MTSAIPTARSPRWFRPRMPPCWTRPTSMPTRLSPPRFGSSAPNGSLTEHIDAAWAPLGGGFVFLRNTPFSKTAGDNRQAGKTRHERNYPYNDQYRYCAGRRRFRRPAGRDPRCGRLVRRLRDHRHHRRGRR
ncbi:protein of unknown function [Magnetospirillum sp. XM-1]|nr:protein of unknown function [Magnetospirillum sp. XM-1]